jgi:hypothetical protein
MKTKLTLNIDDKIVARAKKVSTRKKISLSSIVENYWKNFQMEILIKQKIKNENQLLTE